MDFFKHINRNQKFTKKSITLMFFLTLSMVACAQPFTEVENTAFLHLRESSVGFSDIDGDNDQDVLLIGYDENGQALTKLYQNDGQGRFDLIEEVPFERIAAGAIAFADVDGDNDEDVFLTGSNGTGVAIAKLYFNNGMGQFSEATNNTFQGVAFSSIKFLDIDNDNDLDLLTIGRSAARTYHSNLYINNGLGNFVEVEQNVIEGLYSGEIAAADIDGDVDKDLIIIGRNSELASSITRQYINDGNGVFSPLERTVLDSVAAGSVRFGDIDGDSDQDVFLIGGSVTSGMRIANLYRNDGEGNLTRIMNTPFQATTFGSSCLIDIDGDLDLDIFISGFGESEPISKLYMNSGTGEFTELSGAAFEGVTLGDVAFADVDGDLDLDVLLTGVTSTSSITKLYRNDIISSLSDQANLDSRFSIFPNPSKRNQDLVLVNNSNKKASILISVYSSNSQKVVLSMIEVLNHSESKPLRMNTLSPGMYFIVLKMESQILTYKHIIVD